MPETVEIPKVTSCTLAVFYLCPHDECGHPTTTYYAEFQGKDGKYAHSIDRRCPECNQIVRVLRPTP